MAHTEKEMYQGIILQIDGIGHPLRIVLRELVVLRAVPPLVTCLASWHALSGLFRIS